jgi:hypothetical protein
VIPEVMGLRKRDHFVTGVFPFTKCPADPDSLMRFLHQRFAIPRDIQIIFSEAK